MVVRALLRGPVPAKVNSGAEACGLTPARYERVIHHLGSAAIAVKAYALAPDAAKLLRPPPAQGDAQGGRQATGTASATRQPLPPPMGFSGLVVRQRHQDPRRRNRLQRPDNGQTLHHRRTPLAEGDRSCHHGWSAIRRIARAFGTSPAAVQRHKTKMLRDTAAELVKAEQAAHPKPRRLRARPSVLATHPARDEIRSQMIRWEGFLNRDAAASPCVLCPPKRSRTSTASACARSNAGGSPNASPPRQDQPATWIVRFLRGYHCRRAPCSTSAGPPTGHLVGSTSSR